jgi:NADH-quinone oxidoreductase subunit A
MLIFLFFGLFSLFLVFLLKFLSLLLAEKTLLLREELSPYECGFEGSGEVRNKFNVKFYLVAILFIIFDLEVAFLFPWAVALREIGVVGFWSMIAFLAILTVGFIYEWKRGALEWR